MRDLVAGYLVHHGYIDSARAFSRWATLADAGSTTTESSSSLSGAADRRGDEEDQASLPGFASMIHRRSLRAYCHRCQYGRAANALTAMYPGIVERYPELIVQLRCRQLTEMMHRHSVQRSGHPLSSSDPKLRQLPADRNRQATTTSASTADAPCFCTSESVPTLATCDADGDSLPDKNHFPAPGSSAATSCDAMDIDSSLTIEPNTNHLPTTATANPHPQSLSETHAVNLPSGAPYPPHSSVSQPSTDDALGGIDEAEEGAEEFYDDDDGFGLGESLKQQPREASSESTEMETDSVDDNAASRSTSDMASSAPAASQTCSLLGRRQDLDGTASVDDDCEERRRLLRQIQFSRSLMNLAKQVKKKYGSLSRETERLIQQSVSLLAYSSPSSLDCPLRCLLDPSWRDNIASLINSAILTEAHNLPPQPAIEQGLHALQQCFADRQFEEAQTLGHFLLYHLSPSKYATEIRLQQSASTIPPDPPAFHSSSQPMEQTASPTDASTVSTNGVSNGRVSPPKRHLYTPPSSNGVSRRQWRRRQAASPRSNARYVPVVTLASTDEEEEEEEDISMGEEVELHHHEEFDDDDDDVESLEDDEEEEAAVELMTATMEEDGFDEEVEDNVEEEEEEEEDEEEEKSDGEEDQVDSGENFSSFVVGDRGRRRPGGAAGRDGGNSIQNRAPVQNSSRRSASFTTTNSESSRLPGIRPRRYSRLFFGSGNTGGPSTRASRRSANSTHSPSNNTTNHNYSVMCVAETLGRMFRPTQQVYLCCQSHLRYPPSSQCFYSYANKKPSLKSPKTLLTERKTESEVEKQKQQESPGDDGELDNRSLFDP
uniref:CRA domain-containing protein n=2 Tax=Mesocestoides corti TaxID=53468 RepID=A0A5K3EVX9_MESCO